MPSESLSEEELVRKSAITLNDLLEVLSISRKAYQILSTGGDEKALKHTICYQSKVGPQKWIGPSTEAEIIKASTEKKTLIIVPIAFVGEHSETLVELDIEYKDIAKSYGCLDYYRVPALGTNVDFIEALSDLVKVKSTNKSNILNNKACPKDSKKCFYNVREN